MNLLSNISRVEVPFVYVTIGNYTFGKYTKDSGSNINRAHNKGIVYPNFIRSLIVNKVSGLVNNYTLNMIYPITQHDDPNLLEKAFSSVSKSRKIFFSYGDITSPSFIFKEEEAIITDVRTNFDIRNSNISYTITCTSTALQLTAGTYNFKRRIAKPSDVIKELIYNKKYGLLEIFTGMRDKGKVLINNLIASNDKEVVIEAKKNISIFNYLNYLVENMSGQSNTNVELLNDSRYVLNVIDDITGTYGGPYIKVSRMETAVSETESPDMYVIDVGSFSKDMVIDFNIKDDQTYSILYNYSGDINQSNYIYRINNQGEVESRFSPNITLSGNRFKMTEADKNWWTRVTQYPVTASITLKGLLRPAILMTYVKVNVLFYGKKHISSGTYIITKQTDTIDNSGYRTALDLIKIKGDSPNDY